MPTHVITSPPDMPLADAATLMQRKNISCLLVTRGDTPVGILTERDLARFLDRAGMVVDDYLVRDVMSANVVTISEREDLFAAFSLMSGKGIRHLVIVNEKGKAVGIKTFTDLMHRLGEEYLAEVKAVAEVMTRKVVTIGPEAPVREALRVMAEKFVSCVLVLDADGRAAGIVTERDASRIMVAERGSGGTLVREIMSTPVKTIRPERYAFEAVIMMDELRVRHLAVADAEDKVLGIITQTDMVASLIKRYAQLEFMVRKRTRQLVRKNEELEYSNQQLRHLDEIKSSFLTSVSHELRTPLTSLVGFAKITGRVFAEHFADKAQGNPKLEKYGKRISNNLDVMSQEGERMTRLINDFLDLTKIEAGKIDWRDKLIPVSDFVLHACHAVRAQFDKKGNVVLKSCVPDRLPLVFVDMDRMLQVMINLLHNAAKFTDSGSVTVEAANIDDEFVEVRVIDTGKGIPPNEIAKLFDKFHQLEKRGDGSTIEGTGLGLAICKEIVEHYQGRIWVESEPGKGSTFKFRIPVSKPLRDREDDLLLTVAGSEEGGEAPLILAVDDSPGIREYLEQLFVDEGFRIVTVADGETALHVAEELLPNCIIMDLMMPGIDGREAIRRLREKPVTKDIPVIVLSAYPYRSTSGGDVALPKPVDENQLLQTVTGLLRGGRILGRKCILVPNPKGQGNMLMISAGKLRYIRPDELHEHFSKKFCGTMFITGGKDDPITVQKLSTIDDVLVMILPEDS
jgi:signal transduction histidine kinase